MVVGGDVELEAVAQPGPKGRHLKKRALKNKALAVTFNEKDLQDYVTGFHKRKKKRRKEAQKLQEEALKRKRNEERHKRKLERELVYGGAQPAGDAEPDEIDENQKQVESIAEMKTYESGDLKVTVVTREIDPEEEGRLEETKEVLVSHPVVADKKHKVPINSKKSFKKTAKHKSRPKPRSKRDKKKGKKWGKK